ncbi:VOC family protein [Shewanella sp. 1_MG-2023]|uniref:VOC family protein n=1 Tax=unclassified Shewanella TaxID=196818 RepID=UPI001E5ED696|nr:MULTISPECIES: VOC family protein [unclassified Shewanella]MCC4832728.1 VOC family protein [Shewanella sp. 10N.7]MDO6610414.1 VOC family protein [Shewanella sp. 7_MG-2023]MDO6770539.1 VOC family protein [Shewanella sp. 2_MG-2023]MDO6794426.1 VOC family protein [Shewanella sp. 1_MG-2023]
MAKLHRFDHIHIYVEDRAKALTWYQEVMGFEPVAPLSFWAVDNGPLVIAHDDLHLALFESSAAKRTTVAFGVDANNFSLWQQKLSDNEVQFNVSDHQITWSIYFSDPDGNPYEITSFDYDEIAKAN